jgi:hypothetical protein
LLSLITLCLDDGRLFHYLTCWNLPNTVPPSPPPPIYALGIIGKLSMSKGAMVWLCLDLQWKVIEYQTILSKKCNKNKTKYFRESGQVLDECDVLEVIL